MLGNSGPGYYRRDSWSTGKSANPEVGEPELERILLLAQVMCLARANTLPHIALVFTSVIERHEKQLGLKCISHESAQLLKHGSSSYIFITKLSMLFFALLYYNFSIIMYFTFMLTATKNYLGLLQYSLWRAGSMTCVDTKIYKCSSPSCRIVQSLDITTSILPDILSLGNSKYVIQCKQLLYYIVEELTRKKSEQIHNRCKFF